MSDEKKKPTPLYRPQIFDLERLFGGSSTDPNWGFPQGSSILVSGTPGTGKTTFALALARGLLLQHLPAEAEAEAAKTVPKKWCTIAVFPAGRQTAIGGPPTKEEKRKRADEQGEEFCVYYVSNENDPGRLANSFQVTGWFDEDDPLFRKAGPNQKQRFFHIGQRVDTSRPPPTSEELINALTHELRQLHAQAGESKAIIIVDSLSSLLRDCRDRGEERRQSHEFIHRLERAVGKEQVALIFFLTEEASSANSPSVLIGEYIVQFVFRLRLKDTGLGRRLRTIEVVKSHGMPLHIGEHTWSILTEGHSLRHVISLDGLQDHIRQLVTRKWTKPEKATTVEQPAATWESTGIPGLDEMLNFGPQPGPSAPKHTGRDYWIHRELGVDDETLLINCEDTLEKTPREARLGAAHPPGLKPDSTTVVVGPSGSGKMTMCLQFLAAGCYWAKKARGGAADPEHEPLLFINFERPYGEIVDGAPLSQPIREVLGKAHSIYRRRGNLDVNALMAEIRHVVIERRIRRVAIDGLASLLAARTPEDSTHLIENLVLTFGDLANQLSKDLPQEPGKPEKKHAIALFLTYEPETDAVEPLVHVPRLSAFADNLIILRPVVINDHWRQSIHIAKARGLDHDRTVREVCAGRDKEKSAAHVTIEPGLEAFTGLFSSAAAPRKVKLALNLFHENTAEERYNDWLREHLRSTFAYKIKLFGFTRSAITSTLEQLASPTSRIPTSDVKVLNIDEWEVRDGARGLLHLRPFEPSPTKSSLLASEGDFWAWEIAKIKLPDVRDDVPKLRAIPCYLDFGMFCLNLEVAEAAGIDGLRGLLPAAAWPALERGEWVKLADAVPRLWARRETNPESPIAGRWFARPDLANPTTVVDWMGKACAAAGGGPRPIGFAFDLATPEVAAVTFLELAWAFGGPETLLEVQPGQKEIAQGHRDAIAWTLRFLMFLVHEDLMPKQVSVEDASRALFSRHFYSTFVDSLHPRKLSGRARPPGARLMPVPFFPTGVDDAAERRFSLYFDMVERLGRFLGVLAATARHRKAGETEIQKWSKFAAEVAGAATTLAAEGLKRSVKVVENGAETEKEETTEARSARLGAIVAEGLGRLPAWSEQIEEIAVSSLQNKKFQINPTVDYSKMTLDKADKDKLPQVGALDCRDILEFQKRHALRMRLFEEELGDGARSSGVGTILHEASGREATGRAAGVEAGSQPQPSARANARGATGYSCTGSWMIGVQAQTHSAGLSCQLIDEIASLESAWQRAKEGAGIPARKDFYEFYGRDPVTDATYLSWNDLVKSCGARARQRNRAINPEVKVRFFNTVVGRHLRACLYLADCEGTTVDDMIEAGTTAAELICNAIEKEYARELTTSSSPAKENKEASA